MSAVTAPPEVRSPTTAPVEAERERRPLLALGAVPLSGYLLLLLLAPIAVLALYSLWTADFFGVRHVLTTANYRDVFGTSLYSNLLLKSVGIGLIAATVMTAAGFVIAYAITFRLGRAGTPLLILIAVSLLASYLARVYAWGTILGTNGLVNKALQDIGLIGRPLTFLFYGYFAIVVTLIYVYLPIAVLTIYGSLQSIDSRTLEASRDMGAGRLSTVARVVLPQAKQAIAAAFALTFILAASDYITPTLVGGAKGQMVGSVIRDQFGGAANLPLGAALAFSSVASFIVVLALLALAGRLMGGVLRGRLPVALPARMRPSGRIRYALTRVSISVPITGLLMVFLLTPLVVVIVFSFNAGSVPSLPLTGLTTHWYSNIVSQPEFPQALTTSLTTMAIGVGVGLLLGVPAAFALARRPFLARPVVNASVFGPVAIPGVVIGVALLTTYTYLNVRLGVLPTALAHAVLVVPYIVIVVRARLLEFDPRIGEAARDLGAAPRRVLRTITLPIIAPSLLGAALLAAAVSLDEILVTNFTIGANATLPVWILSQIRRGITPAINALAVIILAASIVLVLLAGMAMRLRAPARSRQQMEGLF
jgi:putative spermidine/putrescine transport system permease protein